jgi:hypothetical protein
MGTFKEGLEYFPFNINEEAKLEEKKRRIE